jgi:3D-(3,5/4)-trihydroxycyclohexane-1,2-dione acylhydrolase (decyclizing)
MSKTIRLTMSQALVRFLIAQHTIIDKQTVPLIPGIFAIFGHGNVAALGEALASVRDKFPTYRAHNEQAMAHAAVAYAKANRRRRFLACTTSIGPGATNMVTAAAVAHVNRLPVLLLPGDIFASRRPDPVLQQVESFSDPTVTANDCFKPVSRYWDRITRPEQILRSLPVAINVLLDPAECGPVTLALPQDVQAEAFDYPESFFEPRVHTMVRPGASAGRLRSAATRISKSRAPLIIAGGGVLYSDAMAQLAEFASFHRIPVAETQAGKGSLPFDHPQNVGAIGVTGSSAANALAVQADLVIALGTRMQDFTTASNSLFANAGENFVSVNVCRLDAAKNDALALQGDVARTLQELEALIGSPTTRDEWNATVQGAREAWELSAHQVTRSAEARLPTDAQVIGAVNRVATRNTTVVCAAGGLPGDLHKFWKSREAGDYHVEYGFSCMGYEIAGGLGVKLAQPERDVVVMVGDGSYLMMNSEIATSIALGLRLTIILLDNRGFGCIHRLQTSRGGEAFNNLLDERAPHVDFVAHAASLGAIARKIETVAELEQALPQALRNTKTTVLVINTDPTAGVNIGGAWWDVALPAVSQNPNVARAFKTYQAELDKIRGDE